MNLKDKEKTGETVSQLSHLANLYYSYYKPSVGTLKKHGILKRLRNNQEIVILRPDKGNGIVIMNRKDYICGMNNIINDRSKFKLLTEDPTSLREGQLQRFLRKLKNEGFLMMMYIKVFILRVLDQLECTAYLNYIKCLILYQHLDQYYHQ